MSNDLSAPSLPPRRRSRLWVGLLAVVILALILVGVWWWLNRPIRPVVLTETERRVVEAKVDAIQKPEDPKYEKGTKEIVLTERELNGLLNENTALGKTVSFELANQAVHARVEADLDPDLPLVGGRRLKARARFLVTETPGQLALVLDDVTVWGVSLPNDWLAGLKGRNLLGEVHPRGGR